MSSQQMLLIPSESMDSNKKPDRDENELIRLAKTTRNNFKLHSGSNIDAKGTASKGALPLVIFHAFVKDLKAVRDKYNTNEIKNIGFVTTDTYKKLKDRVWISPIKEHTIIGADPEFLLFDKHDDVVHAYNVLDHEGTLASDGAMAEIRPKPSRSIKQLVENMRSIFKEGLNTGIEQYYWNCACFHENPNRSYPVGGHIHIGNPIEIENIPLDDREYIFKTINKIIDQLIAIPMTKLDVSKESKARRELYGYYGEMRLCDGRLEHRTLSGMWLMHPSLATAVIGTIKLIVIEVFKHIEETNYDIEYCFPNKFRNTDVWDSDFELWKEIQLASDMRCTMNSALMSEILNTGKSGFVGKKVLKNWYNKIRGMSSYKKYSVYADALYDILKIPVKVLTSWNRDIKTNWLEDQKYLIDI